MKIYLKATILSILFFSQSCLKEDDGIIPVSPYAGGLVESGTQGDATYADQIWIDLSNGQMDYTSRTDWDLGFYSGEEFRVILNNSIMMAAAPIEGVTELNQVNSAMVADLQDVVQVANFDPNNVQYIDNVTGDYLNDGTVIAEINADPSENKVYLINMGRGIYDGPVEPETSYAAGNLRGWKKIKITREADAYKIQYADLDDTSYQEFIIQKNPVYNFTFFSMTNNQLIDIQPAKTDWDICYTVFTNVIDGAGTYIYSDFLVSNIWGGASAYQITISGGEDADAAYNNFSATDIDESLFISNDQRVIGSNWRDVFTGVLSDRFYILKDPNGIYFKIRFIRMLDNNSYRGYFQFEYEPL